MIVCVQDLSVYLTSRQEGGQLRVEEKRDNYAVFVLRFKFLSLILKHRLF